jgi:hypothetical protein
MTTWLKVSFLCIRTMPIVRSAISNGDKGDVINYITSRKAHGKFTVIDVGASANGWSGPYLDALVDMNSDTIEDDRIVRFRGDINQDDVWNEVMQYVSLHGKFDFCICTHTIEDIRDPYYVCTQFGKIAKEGYISVPSKHRECARFEFGPHGPRGYIHHRWIYTVTNNNLVAYPKLPIVDYLAELDDVANPSDSVSDLCVYWKDDIKLSLCNDDYMGPNVDAVINYMLELVN